VARLIGASILREQTRSRTRVLARRDRADRAAGQTESAGGQPWGSAFQRVTPAPPHRATASPTVVCPTSPERQMQRHGYEECFSRDLRHASPLLGQGSSDDAYTSFAPVRRHTGPGPASACVARGWRPTFSPRVHRRSDQEIDAAGLAPAAHKAAAMGIGTGRGHRLEAGGLDPQRSNGEATSPSVVTPATSRQDQHTAPRTGIPLRRRQRRLVPGLQGEQNHGRTSQPASMAVFFDRQRHRTSLGCHFAHYGRRSAASSAHDRRDSS